MKKEANRYLEFLPLHKAVEDEARDLILAGFLERFGFIDHSLNPDLKDLMGTYTKEGHVFFVALDDGELVATGAVTKEDHLVGRIERMSVKGSYRRQGIAQRMLEKLEDTARFCKYERLVLETHNSWESAIRLYKSNGYHLVLDDGMRSHFEKVLGDEDFTMKVVKWTSFNHVKEMSSMKEGDVYTWKRTFTNEEVLEFGRISGDQGRHHMEPDDEGKLMVQGLLTATIGTKIGGDLHYIARDMVNEFLRPVFTGDTITCEVNLEKVVQADGHKKVEMKSVYRNQNGKEVLIGSSHGIIRD